jgi:molybdate transport repressor ModE-like protein
MADKTLSLLWDSTRLRLLVEVERHGSVSAAAQAVGIGQSSASEHLRLLETAAGQRLIERNGRGSRLTEAGRVLASSASQALATLAAGEEEVHALAGLDAGTIHIGASTTPGVYLLPDTLGCFRRDHPNVAVEVEIAATGEILDRLLAGRIQLALVGETAVDERVELEPFLSDEIIGIAKPGLLPIRSGKVPPDLIGEQTLLVRERNSSTRQIAERALSEAGASGNWTRARRSSGPPAKGSGSLSSPATRSPRKSNAANSRASASRAARRSSAGFTSPASPVAR